MTATFSKVECPFCGGHFNPEEAQGPCAPCGACQGGGGLWGGEGKKNCALTCPRCGYAVFAPLAPQHKNSLTPHPLTQHPLGQSARVVSLEAKESSLRKLLTLGILPGIQLELERRRPCFLCKVGRARLAFDEALAACIWVV